MSFPIFTVDHSEAEIPGAIPLQIEAFNSKALWYHELIKFGLVEKKRHGLIKFGLV